MISFFFALLIPLLFWFIGKNILVVHAIAKIDKTLRLMKLNWIILRYAYPSLIIPSILINIFIEFHFADVVYEWRHILRKIFLNTLTGGIKYTDKLGNEVFLRTTRVKENVLYFWREYHCSIKKLKLVESWHGGVSALCRGGPDHAEAGLFVDGKSGSLRLDSLFKQKPIVFGLVRVLILKAVRIFKRDLIKKK